MQPFEDGEIRNEWKSMKTSTKLTLLACFLLFLVGLTVLTVQGQYVDVEQAVVSAPETPNASVAITQAQRRH